MGWRKRLRKRLRIENKAGSKKSLEEDSRFDHWIWLNQSGRVEPFVSLQNYCAWLQRWWSWSEMKKGRVTWEREWKRSKAFWQRWLSVFGIRIVRSFELQPGCENPFWICCAFAVVENSRNISRPVTSFSCLATKKSSILQSECFLFQRSMNKEPENKIGLFCQSLKFILKESWRTYQIQDMCFLDVAGGCFGHIYEFIEWYFWSSFTIKMRILSFV